MSEITVMKNVIKVLSRHGYSDKILYRFRDIRTWGSKTMVTLVFIPFATTRNSLDDTIETQILRLDSSNLEGSIEQQLHGLFERIDLLTLS